MKQSILRRWNLRILVVAALGVAWVLYGETTPPAADETAAPTLKRVQVAAVTEVDTRREVRFSGSVRAARRARLGLTTPGRLLERPVEIGDRVRRGDLLARLDDRDLFNAASVARGGLAEVRARRAQAERDRDRAQALFDAKAATPEELEKTGAVVVAMAAAEETAAARLAEAERLLGEARLRAPFDAVVTEVLVEPGEYVLPGSPVVGLAGAGAVEVEVEVPESIVPRLEEGAEVEVVLPLLGRSASGRVLSVGRMAAGAGHLFPVVVTLESDVAAPGMSAEVRFALSTRGALSLPVEAVVDPGGRRPVVFRVRRDGEAERVERVGIKLGELLGDRVAVLGADLAAGDLVVVGGQRGLLDGEGVEVVETTAVETVR